MPKKKKKLKKRTKKLDAWYGKAWYFIWHDNSTWSWIVALILIYVILKFLIYPGIGLIFGTNSPMVVVISDSMEHKEMPFDEWWVENKDYYLTINITRADFSTYPFKNGFNKGDLMFITGKKPENIKIGDVIVFQSQKPYPIIHRVIKKEYKSIWVFETKGDNNEAQVRDDELDEAKVHEKQILGKAIFNIPYIGYIKIWLAELIKAAGINYLFSSNL